MPQTCSICIHDKQEEIDRELIRGTPLRTVSDRFGPSKTSLIRHKSHIVKTVAVAREAAQEAQAETLMGQILTLRSRAQRITDVAEQAGSLGVALQGIRELCRIVELMGQVTGEIQKGAKVGIAVSSGSREPLVVRIVRPGMVLEGSHEGGAANG
jgi:hypothetical protein